MSQTQKKHARNLLPAVSIISSYMGCQCAMWCDTSAFVFMSTKHGTTLTTNKKCPTIRIRISAVLYMSLLATSICDGDCVHSFCVLFGRLSFVQELAKARIV